MEAEEISSLVDATLEDELSDSFPVVAVLLGAVAALRENRPGKVVGNKDKSFRDWL